MQYSAADIAQLLGGAVDGDESVTVNNISKIEDGQPGTLTFLANPKYEPFIYNTQASIALVSTDWKAEQALPADLTLIRVEDAYASLTILLAAYDQQKPKREGVHPNAFIDPSATLGSNVYVGPNATVMASTVIQDNAQIHAGVVIQENCIIGEGSVIHPNCTLYHGTEVGKACIIHAGATIGADGFGFAPRGSGYDKVPQIGNVVIANHVEIGAGTCIDRATLGSTRIEEGVKLDNLIQIAHNVVIGENTVIAAQTGIAGSTKMGKNCMIGGQVGIIGHIDIADEVKIAAQSGIGHAIPEPGSILQGSPAIANRDFKRAYVNFVKLPDLKDRIVKIERQLRADQNT